MVVYGAQPSGSSASGDSGARSNAMRLILRSRATGEELGVLEATATGVIASNAYAREVMDAFERREDSPRSSWYGFLPSLHRRLWEDEHVAVGLKPYKESLPRTKARRRMLEQAYLTELGWAGVIRGSRISFWVAPGEDVKNAPRRFQHEEAVAAAKLPTDFDELESWGAPYVPIDFEALADQSQGGSGPLLRRPLPAEPNGPEPASTEPDLKIAERPEAMIERRLGIRPRDHAGEVDPILRPRRRNPALSYAQRQAVEQRAVAVVVELLEAEGWTVRDVGATHSYDLDCSRPENARLLVEVKGTTQRPESIVLTANEVEVARSHYPNTALYVVHGIALAGDVTPPAASGGTVHVLRPWNPDPDRLRPTAFTYVL